MQLRDMIRALPEEHRKALRELADATGHSNSEDAVCDAIRQLLDPYTPSYGKVRGGRTISGTGIDMSVAIERLPEGKLRDKVLAGTRLKREEKAQVYALCNPTHDVQLDDEIPF